MRRGQFICLATSEFKGSGKEGLCAVFYNGGGYSQDSVGVVGSNACAIDGPPSVRISNFCGIEEALPNQLLGLVTDRRLLVREGDRIRSTHFYFLKEDGVRFLDIQNAFRVVAYHRVRAKVANNNLAEGVPTLVDLAQKIKETSPEKVQLWAARQNPYGALNSVMN